MTEPIFIINEHFQNDDIKLRNAELTKKIGRIYASELGRQSFRRAVNPDKQGNDKDGAYYGEDHLK